MAKITREIELNPKKRIKEKKKEIDSYELRLNELIKKYRKFSLYNNFILKPKLYIYLMYSEKRKKLQEKIRIKKEISEHINLIKKVSATDLEGYKREFKDAKKPGKTFMVNMELRNGMHTHFMVILQWGYFDYEGGRYIIDDDYKYYDVSSKIYCLDYHQDCCIPLKRKFNINAVYTAVSTSTDIETDTSINPKSLKTFMESDIIQKVMKGAEMEAWIKFIKLMLIIITVINGIILILMIKAVFTP